MTPKHWCWHQEIGANLTDFLDLSLCSGQIKFQFCVLAQKILKGVRSVFLTIVHLVGVFGFWWFSPNLQGGNNVSHLILTLKD